MNKLFYAGCTAVLFLSLVSCEDKKNVVAGEKSITIEAVQVDTIAVGQLENTSYTGFSGVCEDSLYFYDGVLGYYYKLGLDGTVGKKRLGLGHGPGEIPTRVDGVSYSPETKLLFGPGSTYDGYTYDESTNTVTRHTMKAPKWDDPYRSPDSYSIWDEYIQVSYKNYIFYNILNEVKPFMVDGDALEKSAIIMRYDTNNEEMVALGNFSKFVVDNQNRVRHLPHIYFDVAEDGTFFVTFQADPSIYHYDKDFNLIASFGFEGEEMDTDYTESTLGMESFGIAYETDIEKVGFYTWLKHVGDYTFRSYRKTATAEKEGLQVYDSNYNLIADVEVPKGLKVTGKIGDYYVSQVVCDEDNQKLSFFRFKLEQ